VPNVLDPSTITFPPFQGQVLNRRVSEALRQPGAEAAAARVKAELELLNDRAAAAHSFEQRVYGASTRLETLYQDEAAAKSSVGRKPDPDRIKRIDEALVEAKAELNRLRARRGEFTTGALETRHNAIVRLIVTSLSGGAKLRFLPPASVPRGTTLETVREKISQLTADLKQVSDAPFTAEYVKTRVARFLDKLAAPISITRALEYDEAPHLPMIALSSEQMIPNAHGILIWMIKDQILERLNREIDECADPKNSLTPDQRVKLTAEIKKEILAAERVEAAVEWEAMQAGEVPAFRHDANPRAILNVEAA
jgi:hypothetical protein